MNKLICNNIMLSKSISYLIIYLLVFVFSLVFASNNIESGHMIIKSILEDNNFTSFILIPSMLLLATSVLNIISNNLILMQRFDNKKELTNYLIKILVISTIIIDIIIVLFMLIFVLILKTSNITISYLLVIILNLVFNSILISLFVLMLRVYFNKYSVIFFMMLLSALVYGFNINLLTTVNNLSLIAFLIKAFIICIEYILILINFPKNMFNGVYR